MKNKITIILISILFAISISNNLFAQSQKSAYEIIIDRDGFSSFGGKNYIFLTIFLNNNTNDTLYYQGADCDNLLFDLKHNSYFHLGTDVCKNFAYSKIALPAHRSQKMEVYLTMDKEPDKDVLLGMNMKLYKWTGSKIAWQTKNALRGKLSDTIILHYDANHQSYWPKEQSKILDKKEQRILPNKDIYLLTNNDRKLYTLTTDEKQMIKPRDTVIRTFKNNELEKAKVISVPVSMHNNSNDTLKFYSMTCSWFEFWGTDRQDIGLPSWGCDGNIPEIVTVAPHHEYKKRLDILYNSTIKKGNQFRISMSLLRVPGDAKRTWDFFWPDEYVRFNKIWSNEMTIQ
jgi:hypothetical protein